MFVAKNSDVTSWHELALIAPVHHILHRVSCSYEMIPNAPKYYEGPMGWIGCVRCEKSPCHFVARTFASIVPILHRVSYSYEMIPNAPKHYETHENMSLGSNGVDRVRSLQKILMRLRGTKFCTSSAHFAPSFVRQPNGPKCSQMVRNTPKHEFRVQWGWIGCFRCEKFQCDFVAQTFALLRPVLYRVL